MLPLARTLLSGEKASALTAPSCFRAPACISPVSGFQRRAQPSTWPEASSVPSSAYVSAGATASAARPLMPLGSQYESARPGCEIPEANRTIRSRDGQHVPRRREARDLSGTGLPEDAEVAEGGCTLPLEPIEQSQRVGAGVPRGLPVDLGHQLGRGDLEGGNRPRFLRPANFAVQVTLDVVDQCQDVGARGLERLGAPCRLQSLFQVGLQEELLGPAQVGLGLVCALIVGHFGLDGSR